MIPIDRFINMITTALGSKNNDQRSQAEFQILNYRDANPSQFFIRCADILIDQNKDLFTRQSAGTVASRLLGMKNNNNGKYYWDQIYPNQKQTIKNKILGSLISHSIQIVRASATIIAVVASIQLPRGQWVDIINSLSTHCNSQDLTIKMASIITLGYICQQIKVSGQYIKNDELKQLILASIVIGTREKHDQINRISLKALQDSLSFLQSMMHQTHYRDTVFEIFTKQFQAVKLIDQTYLALYQFVKVTGQYLHYYKKQLLDLTEAHLQLRDDDASKMNLQLWQVIGSDYAEKQVKNRERIGQNFQMQNFLQSVSQEVLPMIMKVLLIFNKDQQDLQQLRLSASRAIQAFAKICDKRVIDQITSSVGTILNSNDPYHQQASVILFSTICQYPDRDLTVNIFRNGFGPLFALLQSNNKIVVKNSLIGFARLSQTLPEVFLTHQNIGDIVQSVYNFLKVDLKDIRSISAQILSNISQGLKENPQPVSDDPNILLTKIVKYYSQNMLKLHNQQSQVNQKVTTIIMNIVMNTNKRDVITQLIQFMIDEYYNVMNNKNIDQNKEFLIEQVLSVLHTAILAHKNAIPSSQLLAKICELINSHFKMCGVEQQGLSLLGATATTFNKNFQPRAQSYWNYIMHGLQSVNQIATFKASLSCIGDFARMMQSSFFNQASQIMKKLLVYIKQNFDRQLKVWIINCMGDLILSMQQFGEAFLDDILSITDICFQAVYSLTNSQKDQDYVDQLKSSLIEMYSCCLFAFDQQKPNKKLFEHFGNLATFVVRTCDKSVHPTVDYLKSCLYLIFDSSAFYWTFNGYHEKVKNIIQAPQIKNLVNLVSQFSDRQLYSIERKNELSDVIKMRSSLTKVGYKRDNTANTFLKL